MAKTPKKAKNPVNHFSTKAHMQEAYYRKGHYLNEIVKTSVNKRGEPVFTFRVTKSHDGAHVNSYYTINFFMGDAASIASRALWARKFSELMAACSVPVTDGEYNVDLNSLIGKEVAIAYTKAEFSPLPNFLKAEAFDPEWQPKPRTDKTWQEPDNFQPDVPHYDMSEPMGGSTNAKMPF